ncbi:MAG: transcription elongation factor GreA [Calditrichaeota bacterium]|nr:transcription elongation factor GreA [Calditrichota bacterium]
MDYVYLTKEGLEKLKKDLHELKYKIRPQISQKVATAREHGDLKENAEYHAAREELSMVESKVHELESKIARARVISNDEIGTDTVSILNTVTLEDLNRGKKLSYTLVSVEEADFKQNKISITSPVGRALLGRKVGEVVEIQVPAGMLKYKILSIEI